MIKKNIKKIVKFLLKNFELNNINQVSRKLKISVGSSFKILKELEEKEIVVSSSLGNAKYYQLNLKNREAVKLSELLLLEEKRNLKGYSRIYSDEIGKFKNADMIVLFGSILRNKNFNDVDVLFVTDKVKNVTNFCLSVSKVRSKPVVPLILKKRDLVNEIKNKKESVLEIIRTGVVLRGESKFIEVVKNARL